MTWKWFASVLAVLGCAVPFAHCGASTPGCGTAVNDDGPSAVTTKLPPAALPPPRSRPAPPFAPPPNDPSVPAASGATRAGVPAQGASASRVLVAEEVPATDAESARTERLPLIESGGSAIEDPPGVGCLDGFPLAEEFESPFERSTRVSRDFAEYYREGISIAWQQRAVAFRQRELDRRKARNAEEADRLRAEEMLVGVLRSIDSAHHRWSRLHDHRAKQFYLDREALDCKNAELGYDLAKLATERAHLAARVARHQASGP